ncbi:MAG: MBL fold metallo-hydrolase [Ruminococcaceae bacterium]|nr:MBL fold metallo-hydrolase [Oscillospiraceae bacterium]
MAGKQKFPVALTIFLVVICLVVGSVIGVAGAAGYDALTFTSDEAPKALVQGEMQIHFLELGNKYTGDCTYIKAGDVDILIDAGSKTSSIGVISEYINQYVTDNKLEYVIVTHAHQDHYAGFTQLDGSLFDLYEVEVIIDFAKTKQTPNGSSNMYGRYLLERAEEEEAGADHFTAAEWVEEHRGVDGKPGAVALGDSGVTMTVLDSHYYYEDAPSENDYSVCTLFTYGDYNYLFTGDLEEDGEEYLVEYNDLPEVDLYKAGHHGSKTSSSAALLEVIKPKRVCVCCCAGSSEYTDTDANQFPTQAFIDRVAPYTSAIYVTTRCEDYDAGIFASMNGNITVVTTAAGIEVICGSGDYRVLKEWEWFREHRTWPANGK